MKDMMDMLDVKIQDSKKQYKEWYYMKNIFKILILILVGLSVASCELFSPSRWDRINREDQERGRECYRTSSGYFYCEDTK